MYFNQHWMDYTGLTLEESLGHGWNKPFHPDDQQRAWDAWQHATATIGTYSLECRLRRADGVYRWWLIRGVPLRDAAGNILKWFGTCTDIHDLKLAELEISRTNRALQAEIVETEARRGRGRRRQSREERIPGQHEPRDSHAVERRRRHDRSSRSAPTSTPSSASISTWSRRPGESLLTVINDILDFSKIEAGKLTVDVIPFDLSDCLATTLKLLAPRRSEGTGTGL